MIPFYHLSDKKSIDFAFFYQNLFVILNELHDTIITESGSETPRGKKLSRLDNIDLKRIQEI